MADLETYAKTTAIVGGVLSIFVVVSGLVTKKNESKVDVALHMTAMKNAIDSLLVRISVLESALEHARKEREELGPPVTTVKKVRRLWHWYLTLAKRVVSRSATSQSSDRLRATRDGERTSHHGGEPDSEEIELSNEGPPSSDDDD